MAKYHFYLRDHLGSNRVVADACGTVEQVSHYYPYGGLMADISTNQDMQRFRFQGKELDRFENIDWNDHGARHADLQIGRWNTVDPLCEAYYDSSPYTYCGNSPSSMVDNDGCDYWATNDYEQIRTFINAVGGGQSQFDFSGWNHSTDAEFCANLTYNDETHKFYTSYAKVIDGELTVVGKSFDANLTPVSFSGLGYKGAFVYKPITNTLLKIAYALDPLKYYDGWINWECNTEGRIIGVAPITGMAPSFGRGFKGGRMKMGRSIGKMSGNHVIQNKQIRDLASKYKLDDDDIEELHELVHGQGYSYHEIEELIIVFFCK